VAAAELLERLKASHPSDYALGKEGGLLKEHLVNHVNSE
jgi:hypothetical protein